MKGKVGSAAPKVFSATLSYSGEAQGRTGSEGQTGDSLTTGIRRQPHHASHKRKRGSQKSITEQKHLLTGARSQVMILEVSIKSRSAELKTASLWKSEDVLSLTDSNDSNAARTLQFKEMISIVN